MFQDSSLTDTKKLKQGFFLSEENKFLERTVLEMTHGFITMSHNAVERHGSESILVLQLRKKFKTQPLIGFTDHDAHDLLRC